MINHSQVRAGMAVVGSDSKPIGRVKEVRTTDFVLDRKLARDLCVPFDAIGQVEADQVVLKIAAEDTDYQRWQATKLF